MIKIDLEEICKKNPEKAIDSMIYESIQHQNSLDYHNIMGMRLYVSCNESKKAYYAQLIVDYVKSLENNDDAFLLHYAQYENPKIYNGVHSLSVTNEVQLSYGESNVENV